MATKPRAKRTARRAAKDRPTALDRLSDETPPICFPRVIRSMNVAKVASRALATLARG